MKYLEELNRSMEFLALNPKVLFLGQSIRYDGNAIFKTLKNVEDNRKIEMPVAEEMQMGLSIGLALQGYIPITCYPRFDFLVLATNQMVNHLDKLNHISQGKINPKVIIRASIGSVKPLYPGVQHCQNHTEAFKLMCPNINIVTLDEPEQIFPAFEKAILDSKPSLILEYGDYYNEK